MAWKDRAGNPVPGNDGQDRLLEKLYGSTFGRAVVWVMIRPWVSKCAGALMDSSLSRIAIKPFIRKNRIDLSQYEQRSFRSFNDFFTRKVLPGMRQPDMDPAHLIAPCDSKLTVYPICEDARFLVKHTLYDLPTLFKSTELAKKYEGGLFLLFRLTVDDYHRYGFIESGHPGETVHIPGIFHTVNPAACDRLPVYQQNTREYTLIETDTLGTVLQMEVGATMVGRIVNDVRAATVTRGQEKGRFEFGGSTVIVCLEPGRAVIDNDILRNTAEGFETVVKLGEKIGTIPANGGNYV